MNASLIRLLHLASPTLPVGAYTYSQGLEWAVESGEVKDETTAGRWIGDCLSHGAARFEAVYLAHMMAAWQRSDAGRLVELDGEFTASRETAELRAETLQMGHSLVKLLKSLPEVASDGLSRFETPSFPLVWSGLAVQWDIPVAEAVAGYLWAWLENQVMAALKAVPLGQSTGQRLLLELGGRLTALAEAAVSAPLGSACNFLPAFAIASSLHETQYTRIFRS
jgi:urease accessory protein